MLTVSNLGDLLDEHLQSFRHSLSDEGIHARSTLRIQNNAVEESILTALHMTNQGPNDESPSTDHAVPDTPRGDAITQNITKVRRQILS